MASHSHNNTHHQGNMVDVGGGGGGYEEDYLTGGPHQIQVNGNGKAAAPRTGGGGVASATPPAPMGRRKRQPEEKKEGPTSLFILRESNIIRRLTKFLIEWPPFEYTVLLTIIANCVVLAIERPQPNGDKTELARQLVSRLFAKLLI